MLLLALLCLAAAVRAELTFNDAELAQLADAVLQRTRAEQPQERLAPRAHIFNSRDLRLETHQFIDTLDAFFCDVLPRALIALGIFALFAVLAWTGGYFLARAGRVLRAPANYVALARYTWKLSLLLVGAYVALETVGIDIVAVFFGLGIVGFAITTALNGTLGNLGAGFAIRADADLLPGHEISIAGVRGIVREQRLTTVVLDTTSALIGSGAASLTDAERAAIEARRAASSDAVVVPNSYFGSQLYTVHTYHGEFASLRPVGAHLAVHALYDDRKRS